MDNSTTRTADILLPDPFYDPQSSLSNPEGKSVAPPTESTSSVLYESSNNDEAPNSINGGNPPGYNEELIDIVDSGNLAAQRYFLTKSV
jgi:hypothetical protein